MKYLLLVVFVFITGFTNFSGTTVQKYVLIDKKMIQPISYTNKVTSDANFKGFFAIEKIKFKAVLSEIEKIEKDVESNKPKSESVNYNIGNTNFKSVKITLAQQERLDVLLTTDCGEVKTVLHLCDAKLSNANNVYYISTLLKYINSSR